MTTITPFAAGSYLTSRSASQLLTLKNQLNDLSNQVSSGQVSQTYGGLGSGRSTALGAQATLSALTGYAAGITAAQTRTTLAVTSLTQVASLGTGARAALNNGLQSVSAGSVSGRVTALGDLQTALDALNQSAGGNYLFGGSDTTTQPVVDGDTILNGTTDSSGNTLDGLTTLINQRVTAELGAGKNGRLTQSPPPTSPNTTTSVTITDETNSQTRGKFGFTLAAAPTATGAITATFSTLPSGANSFTLGLSGQPAAGDSVTFKLNMPDGTATTLTLTAAATADSTSTTSFAIGSSVTDTMNNLSKTLDNALKGAASGTLAVNATADVASNFFTGSVKGGPSGTGVMPERIQYDAGGNPIGYQPATPQDTVLWYQGENTYTATTPPTQTPAIDTQSVQVSGSASIGTGARAIDPAVQNVLAGLATMAFALPTTSDANTRATYQTVLNKAGTLLASADTSPSVQDTVTQLSLASSHLSGASTTNKATQNTVQNTLDGIEQAPTEEVVAKLLDVQNRLQASYQVTATLSKLSLVNYIS
ncbi:flagellin [Methylobacterium sp. J-070]|uniref:flagellin n=1 Tax=Methylobacterium sp. J-070 TaxID=2836650 RepID=UPI001FBAE055|nr:flagellin [Methylobacterium sp. J-070]MCJ2049582.1 flagellin [Methylobacterium sp. J-070]